MKKHYLLPLALLSFQLSAQELPYTFSAFNEEYVPLTEAASANGDEIWDDPQYLVPIGFTVDIMGESIDNLLIIYPGSQVLPSIAEAEVSVLLPYLEDIMDTGNDKVGSLSPILYKTEGNPGSRIFKIEWQNVGYYEEWANLGTFNNTLSFQMWLYETTNDIEFRYGSNTVKDFDVLHPLGGALVALAKNVNIDTGTWEGLWMLGGDPANPTVSAFNDPENAPDPSLLLSALPASGQVYHFDTGIVGVDETTAMETLKVFPSIAEELVHVNSMDYSVYMIYDNVGNLVKSGKLNPGLNDIPVVDLAAGVYFMRSPEAATAKFIRK